MIQRVFDRLLQCEYVNDIIIATSVLSEDDVIAEHFMSQGLTCTHLCSVCLAIDTKKFLPKTETTAPYDVNEVQNQFTSPPETKTNHVGSDTSND